MLSWCLALPPLRMREWLSRSQRSSTLRCRPKQKVVADVANVYSEEARNAARELRTRLKRDLAAGRFVSSSSSARHPNTTVTEQRGSGSTTASPNG